MVASPKSSQSMLLRRIVIAGISAAGIGVAANLSSCVESRMPAAAPLQAAQTAEGRVVSREASTASASAPLPTTPPATETATVTPSITVFPKPLFSEFVVCRYTCNGFNSVRTFPEKPKEIHAQWSFRNVPRGAAYERIWSLGPEVWVKYSCRWEGPAEGTDRTMVFESRGFRSGTWTVTIRVEGKTVMRETVFVEGHWDYWAPAGEFDFCPASE